MLGHEWMMVSKLLKQALPYLLVAGFAAIAAYIYWRTRLQAALSVVRSENE